MATITPQTMDLDYPACPTVGSVPWNNYVINAIHANLKFGDTPLIGIKGDIIEDSSEATWISSDGSLNTTLAGNLEIEGGHVRIGDGAPATTVGLYITPLAAQFTSTTQYGILHSPTFSDVSTVAQYGIWSRTKGADGSYTTTDVVGHFLAPNFKGSGQTITNNYGIKIDNQTVGSNNWALFTGTGLVSFGDSVAITGDLTVTGNNILGSGGNVMTFSGQDVTFDNFPITPSAAPDADYEVANKKYVDDQVTAEDLDFAGDAGTGAVDLDSQTLTIAGTANEIETSAASQTLTIGLPNDVTIGSDLTVTDSLVVDSPTLVVNASGYTDCVGIGTATPTGKLHLKQNTGVEMLVMDYQINNQYSGEMVFHKYRESVIATGDELGKLRYYGHDGTDITTEGARIEVVTEGTIATDRIPGVINFYTHPDSTSAIVLAMTIDSSQNTTVQKNLTIGDGTAATDFTLTFNGENQNVVFTNMEDEGYLKLDQALFMDSIKKIYFYNTNNFIKGITPNGNEGIVINASGSVYLDVSSTTIMEVDSTDITITDGIDIALDTTTGTKIGTATTQKIGFWNTTPVVQPSHIVDADGTLADITTKFNTLLAQMATTGLQAAS